MAADRLASSVRTSSIPVRCPGDSELEPGRRSDHPIAWDGAALLVERNGE